MGKKGCMEMTHPLLGRLTKCTCRSVIDYRMYQYQLIHVHDDDIIMSLSCCYPLNMHLSVSGQLFLLAHAHMLDTHVHRSLNYKPALK